MTISGLEELTAQGLIDEVPPGGYPGRLGVDSTYDFSHDKLRTLVYEQTSLPRRRLLHRRAAETLGNFRPLQRILFGNEFFRVLVAEGDFQSLDQIHEHQLA